MDFITYLKQPFPKAENKWRNIVLISLFVSLFLVVFQPFGIVHIANGLTKTVFIGGYGLVTFAVLFLELIIVERLFQKSFNERNWCLYKELLWLFCIVLSIGFGNVLYTLLFSGQELTMAYVGRFQLVTFAVAVFPITIFTVTKNNYLVKKYTNSANAVNKGLPAASKDLPIVSQHMLYSYNKKAEITFDINALYTIESNGNDIEIMLFVEGAMVKKTLRNTLKKALEQLTGFPELVQCHRAFIINLNNVSQVEGNSQGLLLKLENSTVEIPVSRSFVPSIKQQLS